MSDDAFFVRLAPGASPDVARLGGKGASLARLVAEDLPVPPTAVVATDAYLRAVSESELAAFVAAVHTAPDDALVAADAVDQAFFAARLSRDVEAAITDGVERVFGGRPIAVRSSATAEDLGAISFAGQYRSWLDVRGGAATLHAIRGTWASLWHPRAIAYRRAWGIDTADVAMAVVLMQMIDANRAGVVFTSDPTGKPTECRIESVEGLGEALVSGQATPTVWLLDRDQVDQADAPVEVRDAARLSLLIEEHEGRPQDVEWAFDGAAVWIVQARPITTASGDEFDSPPDDHELTAEGIAEMLPGALPPLLWEVNSFMVEEAFRQTLADVGALPESCGSGRRFVRRVHGRAALDFDLLRESAAFLAVGAEEELEARYFGTAGSPTPPAPNSRRRRPRFRQQARTTISRRRALDDAEIIVRAADRFDGESPELTSKSPAWLVSYRARVIDLGARAMATEFAVAAVAVAAYGRLEAMLAASLAPVDAALAAQRMTADPNRNPLTRAHASRALFGGPTWAEAPTAELPPAITPTASDVARDRTQIEDDLQALPHWRRTKLLGGEVIDVRLHVLRRLVDDATSGLTTREQVKHAVLTIGGELRRVHRELGRQLVEQGALEVIDDIDLLSGRELASLVSTFTFPRALLTQRRRAVERAEARGPLPLRFRGVPGEDVDTATPPDGEARGNVLTGWAASPGTHTGTARAMSGGEDPSVLAPGDILVAVTTDASWLPFFMRAGAIIVERGGPLSHAAIVARELGVPAVLNIPDATSTLDGRVVTLDGTRGTVVIHDAARAEAME